MEVVSSSDSNTYKDFVLVKTPPVKSKDELEYVRPALILHFEELSRGVVQSKDMAHVAQPQSTPKYTEKKQSLPFDEDDEWVIIESDRMDNKNSTSSSSPKEKLTIQVPLPPTSNRSRASSHDPAVPKSLTDPEFLPIPPSRPHFSPLSPRSPHSSDQLSPRSPQSAPPLTTPQSPPAQSRMSPASPHPLAPFLKENQPLSNQNPHENFILSQSFSGLGSLLQSGAKPEQKLETLSRSECAEHKSGDLFSVTSDDSEDGERREIELQASRMPRSRSMDGLIEGTPRRKLTYVGMNFSFSQFVQN